MKDINEYLIDAHIEHYHNHSVQPYLTMGVGGIVPLLVVVKQDVHLKQLLKLIHNNASSFILLGGGSNVIFPDTVDNSGLIVIINRTADIVEHTEHDSQWIKVNSGAKNSQLMNWNITHGIGGMDFLAGLPGTVGGAAAVNAGAFGESISNILSHAEIVDNTGEVRLVDNGYFEFEYRNSKFKYSDEVIINVFLNFNRQSPELVKEKVNERINYRKAKHPAFNKRSCGCFFKNPIIEGQKTSAGKLIEESGFRGLDYNTLHIAEEHANFIINNGTASFEDIYTLEHRIKTKVQQLKGIRLEREVIFINPEGKKY